MSNLMNSGAFSVVFLLLVLAIPVLALLVWFFVNRASVRANEQVALLEELLEQQKQQTQLLRKLCNGNEPTPPDYRDDELNDDLAFIQLVAER